MPEQLSTTAIWHFFDQARVGRLAVYDHAQQTAELTPVLFATRPGYIYFVTQPGRKLTLLRSYPAGVGMQCDQEYHGTWTSVFGWGRYRDVQPGREWAQATMLLAQKYRSRFVAQLLQQTQQAIKAGPKGLLTMIREASTGCIDLEYVSGRRWRNNAGA